MVPPTIFVSGTIAVLQLCQEIYLKYKSVKRYRDDCKQLCHFVSRVEGFLMETEDEEDMSQPGWQTAFLALHESLLEVGAMFEDCAKFGIVRSIVQADEMNLRLSSIAQRMTMALQLIPIQKAKAADKKLNTISELQAEMRTAQFRATRAAEQQSADLKRLIDQSRVDTSKTQDMLAQVISLLQQDRTSAAAVAAAPGCLEPDCGPPDGGSRAAAAAGIQLDEEIKDLQEELLIARKDKKIIEEQYLAQIIAAIESLEVGEPQLIPAAAASPVAPVSSPPIPPRDLLCPITCELLGDPVLLVDSCQTYERAAIQEWLSRGNTKDPVTGIQLTSTNLVPNVLVKKLAREWLDEHPQYRREAAAAAAAAAQYDAALPAQYVVNKTSPVESGAGSNSSEKPLKGEKGSGAEDFQLNPKAAALLAAAAASGAGDTGSSKNAALSYFDPAMLLTVSSNTPRPAQQPSADADEKTAAQRAYAAAVAAAAAHEASTTQGVAVFPAVRMSQSMISREAPAVPAPSRALHHSATVVAHKTVPAAAPAGSSTRIDEQLSAQEEFKLWRQQQEQRDAQEFALWQQQRRRASQSSSSGTHLEEPEQGAFVRYQQQELEAQDVPARLSLSDTVPHPSSSRQFTPEEQHTQQQSQHERDAEAYALWVRQQQVDGHQAQGGRSLQPSSTSVRRSAAIRDHALSPEEQLTLEHFRATFKHMAETRAAITLKHGSQQEQQRMQQKLAMQEQQQQQHLQRAVSAHPAPAAGHDAPLHTVRSMPPSHTSHTAAGPVNAVRAASYPGGAGVAGSSTAKSVAASSASTSSAKSGFGGFFGKKKSSKVDADDDAVSVRSDSSGGTNASKKSVGKSMLGALKNISYTMVYQDDKC